MCEECRHYPCISSCPCAPEPEPVYTCAHCDDAIYAGEYVYEIDGKYYCETCIDNAGYIAEAPEEPEIDAMDVYKAYIEREMCDEL
jgi:hypothetical protein